jgi:hypothetical protein
MISIRKFFKCLGLILAYILYNVWGVIGSLMVFVISILTNRDLTMLGERRVKDWLIFEWRVMRSM